MQAAQAEEEVRQWEEKREQQVFLAEDDMRHSKADLQLQIKAADAGLAAFIKDLTRFEGGLQETPVIKDPALESPQEPEEVDAWYAYSVALDKQPDFASYSGLKLLHGTSLI